MQLRPLYRLFSSQTVTAATSNAAPNVRIHAVAQPAITSTAVTTSDPTFHLAVALPLGSRMETGETMGATVAAKHLLFKSNRLASQLALTREAEWRPSQIHVHHSPESLVLCATTPSTKIGDLLDHVSHMATQLVYASHEQHQVLDALVLDHRLAVLDTERYLQGQSLKVAYRNGLGNALSVDPEVTDAEHAVHLAPAVKYAAIQKYGAAVVLVGRGAESFVASTKEAFDEALSDWTQGFDQAPAALLNVASRYVGGLIRIPAVQAESTQIRIAFPLPNGTAPAVAHAVQALLDTARPAVPFSDAIRNFQKRFPSIPKELAEATYNHKTTLQQFTDGALVTLALDAKLSLSASQVALLIRGIVQGISSVAQDASVTIRAQRASQAETAEETAYRTAHQLLTTGQVTSVSISNAATESAVKLIESWKKVRPSVAIRGRFALLPFEEDYSA